MFCGHFTYADTLCDRVRKYLGLKKKKTKKSTNASSRPSLTVQVLTPKPENHDARGFANRLPLPSNRRIGNLSVIPTVSATIDSDPNEIEEDKPSVAVVPVFNGAGHPRRLPPISSYTNRYTPQLERVTRPRKSVIVAL